MRGVFIIMATPYTASDAVDYEDLAREVDFLDRCGVQGMVWPQLASEYSKLTREERLRGMEVIAKAAKGKKPARSSPALPMVSRTLWLPRSCEFATPAQRATNPSSAP